MTDYMIVNISLETTIQNSSIFLKLNSTLIFSFYSLVFNHLKLFPTEDHHYNFDSFPEGKILVKLNSTKLTFKSNFTTPQTFHGEITLCNTTFFLISCTYAHNDAQDRHDLWNMLSSLATSIKSLWILMKDFNSTLYSNEKEGGKPTLISRIIDFRECITNSHLIKLDSYGLFLLCPINYKVDRVFFNAHWLKDFLMSFYRVISPLFSNHSPPHLHSH